jgi:hypothetical protein
MRMSEAVQDKSMHHLASTHLTMCKLMPGIMHGILNKSLHHYIIQSSYLPENANNVEQRIRIFATVVMLFSPILRLITLANLE